MKKISDKEFNDAMITIFHAFLQKYKEGNTARPITCVEREFPIRVTDEDDNVVEETTFGLRVFFTLNPKRVGGLGEYEED